MNYEELSRQIEQLVGGRDNVASFTNCMTRLRLNVKDVDQVDVEGIKALDGVLGVVPGEQTQVVVGPGHAERLRQAFETTSGITPTAELDVDADDSDVQAAVPAGAAAAGATGAGAAVADSSVADSRRGAEDRDLAAETKAKVKARQTSSLQRGFRHIGNIFVPVIPGFIACGLITSIANVWKVADPTIAKNPWFLAFAALGGIVVGFLNLIVGHNTAKEFGGTPILGFIAGGVPYMTALAGIAATGKSPAQPLTLPFFGQLSPGLGGVIGVILTAWIFTVIEKQLRKWVPAALELFIVPVVTVLVGAALCIAIIMPISALIMKGLTWLLVDFALVKGGVIGGFIMATLFLPMVMLGVHQGLTPLHAQLIAQHGYTQLLPILAMAGAGQDGMAIAVYLKTRNKKLRQVIRGAFPIGLLGIGEPLIYGVSLPLVYPFITACLGAGFGGAFVAWGMQQGGPFGAQALGLSGVLMTPVITPGHWLWYLGGMAVSVVMGFVLTFFFGFKESMADRIM